MPALGAAFDWLSELPQGNVGLWILFLLAVGGFLIVLFDRLRTKSYIEFLGEWSGTYDAAAKHLEVSGKVTMISPSVSFVATCWVMLGSVSWWWFWRERLAHNSQYIALALTSHGRHMMVPDTTVLTFSMENVAVSDAISEMGVVVRLRLGDGTKKRMEQRLALSKPQTEHTAEDAQEMPGREPGEQ